MELHRGTVEAGTLDLIVTLSSDEHFSQFYLIGGTALSLQLGHRKSIDIDFFSSESFESESLAHHLYVEYRAEIVGILKNGVFGFINGVKVDIMSHQYPWLHPANQEEGIRMASLDDIAAMKLSAIVGNGSRQKDFLDMYILLEHRTLNQMAEMYERKYGTMNAQTAKNALIYFNDIKFESIELINRPIRWGHVASRLNMAYVHPNKLFPSEIDRRNSHAFLMEMREWYGASERSRNRSRGYGYSR